MAGFCCRFEMLNTLALQLVWQAWGFETCCGCRLLGEDSPASKSHAVLRLPCLAGLHNHTGHKVTDLHRFFLAEMIILTVAIKIKICATYDVILSINKKYIYIYHFISIYTYIKQKWLRTSKQISNQHLLWPKDLVILGYSSERSQSGLLFFYENRLKLCTNTTSCVSSKTPCYMQRSIGEAFVARKKTACRKVRLNW